MNNTKAVDVKNQAVSQVLMSAKTEKEIRKKKEKIKN